MSLEQEAADLLERAADGYESGRYGWLKGVSYARHPLTGKESFCAAGALQREAGDSSESRAMAAVLRLTEKKLAEVAEVRDVPHWNDYIATSVTEVIEKMKEAAKDLRNGELA